MSGTAVVQALLLDGNGGARSPGLEDIVDWRPADGLLWLHLDIDSEAGAAWIRQHGRLPEHAMEALFAESTRPRLNLSGDSILLALRGVNLNPGSDPEDMVSIRIFASQERIISVQRRRLVSVEDLVNQLLQGEGPRNAGDFMVDLSACLVRRMEETIEGVEDRVDELEELALTGAGESLRWKLSDLRRRAILMRRHLVPQREALNRLGLERVTWISETQRLQLREVTDGLTRHIEGLDTARDRAQLAQEELVNQVSEQQNRRMYVLALVSGVFLPLGFLTGLLGVNLGGIPGADNPHAFIYFLLVLCIIGLIVLFFFVRSRWLRGVEMD